MTDPNQLKWLLIDTEWTFANGNFFPSKKPQFIAASRIKHRQFCCNASWMWDHQVSVQSVSVLDDRKQFEENFRNDKVVAVAMHKVMSEADVIVAHNLDRFDLPMLNVIFALYGLGPIPEKKMIDTLKAARNNFRFAGNGLDDLLKFFGHAGKAEKPDWDKLTDGNEAEIKKSIKYCNRDVKGLQIVLHILKPYMKNLPKPRVIKQPKLRKQVNFYGIECCDACGSKMLRNKGLENSGNKPYPSVRCMECNHYMKGSMKLWKAAHK